MNKPQWDFDQNTKKKIIHENASENVVCEMAAILSRGDEFWLMASQRQPHNL